MGNQPLEWVQVSPRLNWCRESQWVREITLSSVPSNLTFRGSGSCFRFPCTTLVPGTGRTVFTPLSPFFPRQDPRENPVKTPGLFRRTSEMLGSLPQPSVKPPPQTLHQNPPPLPSKPPPPRPVKTNAACRAPRRWRARARWRPRRRSSATSRPWSRGGRFRHGDFVFFSFSPLFAAHFFFGGGAQPFF